MGYKAESFDLWQYLCADAYDPLIRCRIDFDGHIDEAALKKAVTASIQTIPMVGCAFGRSWPKPRWIQKGFTGDDIVHVSEASAMHEEASVARRLSSRIDYGAEPPLKIFVSRKHGSDTLCVIISHILCDGAGFKQYLYLMSKLYTQLANGEPASAPPFVSRGTKPLFAGIALKERLEIMRSDFFSYNSQYNPTRYGVDLNEGASVTVMDRRSIPEADLACVKGFAKDRGASVNDAMMAFFARSYCKNTGSRQIMFPSTMDLRRFISRDQAHGIGNYSSNCMCSVHHRPGDSPADTLDQVSIQMREFKTGNSVLKSIMLWDLASLKSWKSLKRYFDKYHTHPVVSYTNLGIIDANELRFGETRIKDAYITGSIKPRPYLQLSVSTFNGRCMLGCNIYGSEADQRFVARLLDDMRAEIASLNANLAAAK